VYKGNRDYFSLKCRTLDEASLICEELEKVDILAALPDDHELEMQFKRQGYVEIKVSAAAYTHLSDLRSSVEFNYSQKAAEKRISVQEIIVSIGCGLLMPFGALVFYKLYFSNKKCGHLRKANEICHWFTVGAVAWLAAVLILCIAVTRDNRR